jgi:hypothetical protein
VATKQKVSPETVVEKLRAIRSEIEENVLDLSFDQRRDLRNRIKTSQESIISSINAIGMSDKLAGAVGRPASEVRGILEASNRWVAVEGELRVLLNAVSSANLMRRYQLALIAMQTFAITKQLIRDPANNQLIPQFTEMTRLRKLERLKRPAAKKDEDEPA